MVLYSNFAFKTQCWLVFTGSLILHESGRVWPTRLGTGTVQWTQRLMLHDYILVCKYVHVKYQPRSQAAWGERKLPGNEASEVLATFPGHVGEKAAWE